jgi:predicted Zn-ribbon and HTH transcriptional regulator
MDQKTIDKIRGMLLIQISEHFSETEVTCRDGCGQTLTSDPHIKMMENFRAYLCLHERREIFLHVNSWNRCRTHNERFAKEKCRKCGFFVEHIHIAECPDCHSREILHLGSHPQSYHVTGRAADITARGVTIWRLKQYAKKCHRPDGILWGGLGLYNSFIHIDDMNYRRW